MTGLSQKTASEISHLLQNQKISPCDIMDDYIKRINDLNPTLNAFAHLDLEQAKQAALASQKRWQNGTNLSPFDGVGFTAKDLMPAKNTPYRQASHLCSADICNEDAPAVTRMKELGMILLGKTTTCEFGHKGVTDSPLHGISRNPHNPNKTCGGSSGGAAISSACGFGHFHLGNDGGGSLRIPASFCGQYGFKPSPNIVPIYPSGWMSEMRLSTAGLISRDMNDLIIGMDIIAQSDARVSDKHHQQNFTQGYEDQETQFKIGIADHIPNIETTRFFDTEILSYVALQAEKHLSPFAEIDKDSFYPNITDVFNIYWQQIAHFIVEDLSKKERQKMDPHFLFWAARGANQTMYDITKAHHARIEIKESMHRFFQEYDFLVCPTMGIAPLDIETNAPTDAKGALWHDWSPFTYLANLAELPAISMPIGLDNQNLPIGLQIIAPKGHDKKLLHFAKKISAQLEPIKVIETL